MYRKYDNVFINIELLKLCVKSPLTSSTAVLLTPGRTRNIAQDMEALRLSRQDNPYLQQVMASRESLIESHAEECGSDDTILMSQEFGSAALDFVEDDPLTLKEVHEHMIRSPPPTSCWPHGRAVPRAGSAFGFAECAPAAAAAAVSAPPAAPVERHKVTAAAFPAHTAHTAHAARSARECRVRKRRGGVRQQLNSVPQSPGRRAGAGAGGARAPRSSRSASPREHAPAGAARPLSLPETGQADDEGEACTERVTFLSRADGPRRGQACHSVYRRYNEGRGLPLSRPASASGTRRRSFAAGDGQLKTPRCRRAAPPAPPAERFSLLPPRRALSRRADDSVRLVPAADK
ncbi:uncharacterized protein [Battus philenor]|uniref:uncharacterized protein n=1 Tax=Battus philenor TaxID=42288 RepID=UPI0035D10027